MNKFHKNRRKPGKKTTDSAILHVLETEFDVAERNEDPERKDFDDFYKMVHCIRDKKPNDWDSDIYLPEFVSRLLTQIGNFVQTYFSSRTFVETNVSEADGIQDLKESKAAEKLLNHILNRKDNYYFEKVVRLLMSVFPAGYGIMKGSYRQRTQEIQTGVRSEVSYDRDVDGNFLDTTGQVYQGLPGQGLSKRTVEVPVYGQQILEDRPLFDVYPIQRVYMSKEYAYSLNDKEYVILETEYTLDELKSMAEFNEYKNLDVLAKYTTEPMQRNTTTSNIDGKYEENDYPVSPKFLVRERWGKFPVVVNEIGPKGNPVKVSPGVNEKGEWKDNAELHECIITWAVKNEDDEEVSTLIGFRVSPHSKRPLVRFKCYVDALKDTGFGDGEMTYELQTAANDMYNLGNYRSKLAITPSFKSKKFAGIPEKVRITPEKTIELENLDDLQEFTIKDDIVGHMSHVQHLSSRMDYAMATSPQNMGMSPDRRETATMASIMNTGYNIRQGLKSLTLEFIGFTEFYDMLLTLVNDFMLPDTLHKILGEQAYDYNPNREDRFRPVSQALETEESKQFKVKMWDQILGRIVNIPNPKTPLAINYILGQILELMDGDFKHFRKFMFSEDIEANMMYMLATGGKGGVSAQTSGGMSGGGGPQNQLGLPQGQIEQGTRV